jgi:uncharacterized membrane protein YfcA
MDVAGALAIGFAAGVVAGMLGVGGGILFVPALVLFADLNQVDAEATSLLAIVPVALVGAVRQRAYGNVRLGDAALVGGLSAAGVTLGVVVANAVPERALEVSFAVLVLWVAWRLGLRAIEPGAPASTPAERAAEPGEGPAVFVPPIDGGSSS